MSVRLVLDSSVIVASMRPSEPGHEDSVAFLTPLRGAVERGLAVVFGPPELWLEAHVAVQKGMKAGDKPPSPSAEEILAGLGVKLTPMTSAEEIADFLARLAKRTRGKAPFANATDLVYLWVAWREGATLITLDRGLLKYDGAVCDVMRPFHADFA